MLTKEFELELKALEDGVIEALISPYNIVDRVGDRVRPGAFTKSLEKLAATGGKIPVILSHKHDDPFATIGESTVEDFVDTKRGMFARGRLDMENPVAAQAHKLMKKGLLKDVSIGYSIPKGGELRAKDGAYDLTEIDLVEWGPTLKGAAPGAQIVSIKSALESLEQEREDAPSLEEVVKMVQDLELLVKSLSPEEVEEVEESTDEGIRVKSEDQDWLAIYQREIAMREV